METAAAPRRNWDWVAIFTCLLVVVSFLQVVWIRKTLQATDEAMRKTQRAFVFPQGFEITTLGEAVRFTPKWENSGSTPTRKLRTHVNYKIFSQDPPDNYEFPDLDADGNPLKTDLESEHLAFIGPKGITVGYNLDIPMTIMRAVADGKLKLLFGDGQIMKTFSVNHIALSSVMRCEPR